MRQCLLTLIVLAVSTMCICSSYSQTSGPLDSRFQSANKAVIPSTERPIFSKLQVEDIFEKIKIGLTCESKENSIHNYLFTDSDVERFLNEFESINQPKGAVSRTAAKGNLQAMLNATKTEVERIGRVDDLTLVGYTLNYSDPAKVYRVIQFDLDAVVNGNSSYLNALIVELFPGNYKIFSFRQK